MNIFSFLVKTANEQIIQIFFYETCKRKYKKEMKEYPCLILSKYRQFVWPGIDKKKKKKKKQQQKKKKKKKTVFSPFLAQSC